jgi:serine acetyltransferase
LSETIIKRGAALGANSTIRCGITIGEWGMVGSGSVVTKNVPAHGLVFGNPAKLHGFVCACGMELEEESRKGDAVTAVCPKCSRKVEISIQDWESAK